MKKLLASLIILILLPGCWGLSELEKVAIVSGVGIDVIEPTKIRVTTEILKPSDIRKGKPEPYIIADAEGLTVFEAVRDFIITQGKKLLWSHVNVLIIGEETAKNSVVPIVGFLMRDHEPRPSMKVLVAEGSASDIMHIKSKQGPTTMTIRTGLEEQASLSKAPNIEFHEFNQALFSPVRDPYVPIIRKSDDGFKIYGTAIFKKSRMVGTLTSEETRGLHRVLGKLKGGVQVIQLPSDHPLFISLEIKESNTDVKVKIVNHKPKILIEVKEMAFIGSDTGGLYLTMEQYEQIKAIYKKVIRKEMEQTIKKVQKELKSNALAFDLAVRTQKKEYWNQVKDQWDKIYPSIEVEIKVETEIPEEGLVKSNVVH